MTCIVGVVDAGGVYIGGDSCGSDGYSQTIRADTKVWACEDFVFGFTSSFRMGQLLRYRLAVREQKRSESVEEYMVGPFVDAVRECLREGGYIKVDSSVESGGVFLVGYRGRLFQVQRDFQVGESTDGWDAVGCGEDTARGALYVTAGMAPIERIENALAAASHVNVGVRGPFHIECLENA